MQFYVSFSLLSAEYTRT